MSSNSAKRSCGHSRSSPASARSTSARVLVYSRANGRCCRDRRADLRGGRQREHACPRQGAQAASGSGPIEYQEAGAHTLPYADASFDVAVCTQVYEYVDDVPAALLELGRVLRPGGRALVLDTDWDSIVWASSDNERMDRVLAAWEEHLVHPHLPRTLTRLLRDAGLEVTDRQIVPLFNAGYDPNTYSAGMLELIATFVADRNGVSEAEATAWAQDLTELGPNYFLSLNRYLFLAHKPT